MPYVKADDREPQVPTTPGMLAYQLAERIGQYLANKPLSYAAYAEVFGVLTTLQHELYRRFVGPYEDQALIRNGDVPTWTRVRDQASGDWSSGQSGPYRYEWRDGTC